MLTPAPIPPPATYRWPGKGTCKDQFCHCEPPYFSIGCSRRTVYPANHSQPSPVTFKIYMCVGRRKEGAHGGCCCCWLLLASRSQRHACDSCLLPTLSVSLLHRYELQTQLAYDREYFAGWQDHDGIYTSYQKARGC